MEKELLLGEKEKSYSDLEFFQDFFGVLQEKFEDSFEIEDDESEIKFNAKQENNFIQLFTSTSLGAQILKQHLGYHIERSMQEEKFKFLNDFVKYSLNQEERKEGGILRDLYEGKNFLKGVNQMLKDLEDDWRVGKKDFEYENMTEKAS